MNLWIDAQLSPSIAPWLKEEFNLSARAVRDLGFRDANDSEIFFAARKSNAVVPAKDADFARLLHRYGPPPKVIWVTCGNTSNARLKVVFKKALPRALDFLKAGDSFVEISDERF